MVRDVEAVELPRLPMEVWVTILSHLDGPDLLRCEGVCRAWRAEIRHQLDTGLLTRRGLRCSRLRTEATGYTEHRRNIWDSLSVKCDQSVLIVGVGVYSPSGHTQVCVDARPLEDNLRPIDVATELDSINEEDGNIMTLFGKPGSTKPFRFRLEAEQWWELMLNISPVKTGYDPVSGGCVWAARGGAGRTEVSCHGVTFSFRPTVREGWRSEVEEGQFPVFYFWRL